MSDLLTFEQCIESGPGFYPADERTSLGILVLNGHRWQTTPTTPIAVFISLRDNKIFKIEQVMGAKEWKFLPKIEVAEIGISLVLKE